MRIQIYYHDTKVTLDFEAADIDVIHRPFRASRANAYAKRWVRTLRADCLGRLLVLSEAHLRRVVDVYVDNHNCARSHQGISQQMPIANEPSV